MLQETQAKRTSPPQAQRKDQPRKDFLHLLQESSISVRLQDPGLKCSDKGYHHQAKSFP